MSLRYHVQNPVGRSNADGIVESEHLKGWVTTSAFMCLADAVHWARMDGQDGGQSRLLDNKTGVIIDWTKMSGAEIDAQSDADLQAGGSPLQG